MPHIYEIYYENKQGDVVHCQDLYDEQEALHEITSLSNEFPDNDYWYEIIFEDEQ